MISNDVVIVGGFINGFSNATNNTYARDVTNLTGGWRRMDDLPIVTGITHAAVAVAGMKLYMCGGYLGGHPGPHIPYCFMYDHSKSPGTGQWSKVADIPQNGTGGGGMVYDTAQNALYYASGGQRLIRGKADADDVNRTWKYSINTPEHGWVSAAPIPYVANHISFVTGIDQNGQERHFFFGGQQSENETLANLADNYEWDAINEQWISRASMPFGRGHTASSSVPVGCGFLVASGAINSDSSTVKKTKTVDISYYDIGWNTWTSIGNTTIAVNTPIAHVSKDGYMYFIYRNAISKRRGISF
jgi:hypothetical protein